MAEKKTQMPLWLESIVLIVTALIMATIIKTFLFQAFYIPSASMEPTLLPNDRILVQKVSYWNSEPKRGEIVVFDDPGGWLGGSNAEPDLNFAQRALETVGLYPSGGHLIKRVIGVGGDEVSCCDDDGFTTVNGVPIVEPYLASPEANSAIRFTVEIPEGHLWLQGDNRGNSSDSRAHLGNPGGGFISVNQVVGRAWVTIWPQDRMGGFDDVDAFDEVP